jgi:hypothetical protein
MVPRMADHPIPKLADVVWGFYPEQAEHRRERATGLGKSAHEAWPALENQPAEDLGCTEP